MNETVEFDLSTGTPRRIGHFTIIAPLGSGAMGSVYRAKDNNLGTIVALKVIKPELAKEPSSRERFLREARAAAALREHENIVPVYNASQIAMNDGRYLLYLVMPLLKGETLQDRLRRTNGQPLPLNEQILIGREITEGLIAAHDEGLVHRDIKPGNIWLEARKNGSTRVKILDFGIARSKADAQLTTTGATLGTPAYMAPEQGLSSDVDHRADLWSLGVILFQMATGRLPFSGANPMEIVLNAQDQPLPSPRELNPLLSNEHVRLIEHLLQKRPEERTQSAADVLNRLQTIESSTGKPTLPSLPILSRETPSAKRWVILLMIILMNVALVAWLIRTRDPKPTPIAPTKEQSTVSEPIPPIEVKKPLPTMPTIEPKEPPLLTCPATAAEMNRLQQEWAGYLRVDPVTEVLGSGMKLKMVLIPPGKFRMGSSVNERVFEDDEKPSREVTISKAFYLGMYEVSRGEFRRFVDEEQYQTEAEADGTGSDHWDKVKEVFRKDKSIIWKNAGFEQTDDHPVVNVSWNDAQAFCRWASRRTGRTVVLPSEAEWEYACRAGTTTRFSFGDDAELLASNANSPDATAKEEFPEWKTIMGDDGYAYTAPIGTFKPNAFGLYDMHGNVYEWCHDWYGPYQGLPLKNPLRDVKQTANHRVMRGGSWRLSPLFCRSAVRLYYAPDGRSYTIGFRVCIRLD